MDELINVSDIENMEIQIEELEAKIAPDGGETVLPLLSRPIRHR